MNSPSWPQPPHLSSPALLPEWAQEPGVREAGSCRPEATSPSLKRTQTSLVQDEQPEAPTQRCPISLGNRPLAQQAQARSTLTVCHMALLSVTKNSSGSAVSWVFSCCFPCSRQCCLYKDSMALDRESNCGLLGACSGHAACWGILWAPRSDLTPALREVTAVSLGFKQENGRPG